MYFRDTAKHQFWPALSKAKQSLHVTIAPRAHGPYWVKPAVEVPLPSPSNPREKVHHIFITHLATSPILSAVSS